MHFVAILFDRDDGLPTRLANRPAHIDWLKTVPVRVAGPFLDDHGDMNGSMFVIEAETTAEVQAILDTDPYGKAGLFKSSEIRPWRWAVGKPA